MDVTLAHSMLFCGCKRREGNNFLIDLTVVNHYALTNLGKEAKRPRAIISGHFR